MKSPSWMRRLLSLLAARDRVDDVLGDFEEVHQARLNDGRSQAAAWWLSSVEGLTIAAALLACRWLDRERVLPWWTGTQWRLAVRRTMRQPLMALTTVLALAVGIALATTAFSALEAALFSELPFANGERFVRLNAHHETSGSTQLDLDRYQAFAAADDIFEHVGAMGMDPVNLRHISGEIESVVAGLVTPSSFAHLPYVPLLGRPFLDSDGQPGAAPVMLIRESLWHRRFGGEPSVIGQALEVGGARHTVVGVLPDSAAFPAWGEVWLPLDSRYLGGNAEGPHPRALVFAILAEDVTLDQAQVRLEALSSQVAIALAEQGEVRVQVASYTEMPAGAIPGFSMLVVVLVMLLVVVASNIANLNLARISARTSELTMRSALGASRSVLVGQILAEIFLLCVVAALLGLSAAHRALLFFNETLDERPFWIDFTSGPRTIVFVILITLLVSAVGGLIPALRATRGAAVGGLRGGLRHNFGFGRFGAVMTIVEMGVSVALLSGSLVMAKGLAGYDQQVLKVAEDRILTARLVAPSPMPGAPSNLQDLPDALAQSMARIPGVLAHGLTSDLPRSDAWARPVEVVRETGESKIEAPRSAPIVRVRNGFLETLGADALVGRLFREQDFATDAPRVAVVNEPFVEKFLGGRPALGRRVRSLGADDSEADQEWEIVGVVPEMGLSVASPDRAAGFYVPMVNVSQGFYVALRTSGDPSSVASELRLAVAEVDPRIRVLKVLPLRQVGQEERDFFTGLGSSLVAMGCLALLLSLVGIYAMTTLTLGRRTREIGIRIAMGANSREILTMVLGATGRYLALGGVLGAIFAAGFMAMQDRMFVVRLPAQEPWIVPLVIFVLAFAGLLATWLPARRALSIEPSDALRDD